MVGGKMMKAQITLTVAEAKALIAQGIAALPEVHAAVRSGKIFFKGGTTVSAVAERLAGMPMKISGRITPRGCKTGEQELETGHTLLFSMGHGEYVDHRLKEVVVGLGKGDIVIIGANALDYQGQAAMMVGGALGGPPGEVMVGLLAEGTTVLIAAGLEKMIPGTISRAIAASGRKKIDLAMGMAVGLVSLPGRVITEQVALNILTGVECTVIGMGGVFGAEGATTMILDGTKEQVEHSLTLVQQLKGAKTGGLEQSFPECSRGHSKCKAHLGCLYRKGLW